MASVNMVRLQTLQCQRCGHIVRPVKDIDPRTRRCWKCGSKGKMKEVVVMRANDATA